MNLQRGLRIAACLCFVVAWAITVGWANLDNVGAWFAAGFALLAGGLI